jgi:hypothetical protein
MGYHIQHYLAFEPKKKLFLLTPLQHESFYVDPKLQVVENNCNLDTINSSIKKLR